jgi:hypothetical protein
LSLSAVASASMRELYGGHRRKPHSEAPLGGLQPEPGEASREGPDHSNNRELATVATTPGDFRDKISNEKKLLSVPSSVRGIRSLEKRLADRGPPLGFLTIVAADRPNDRRERVFSQSPSDTSMPSQNTHCESSGDDACTGAPPFREL